MNSRARNALIPVLGINVGLALVQDNKPGRMAAVIAVILCAYFIGKFSK